jgi:hypothetical protein
LNEHESQLLKRERKRDRSQLLTILLRGYQRGTPEPLQWQLQSRNLPTLFLLLPLPMEVETSTSEILKKRFRELLFVCGDT